MTYTDRDVASDRRSSGRRDGKGWLTWLIVALVVLALVVIGFFAFGGDIDADSEGELDVNVETPESDVDVAPPDVEAEAPDVDVDPGSVDVEEGEAEAEAG